MMLNRTSMLGLGLLGLAVNGAVAEKKAPNILFIFTDDHSTNALSIYGSKINKTPNLDRIGREGAVFDRCYVANAISGPSRACIMTGMHSHTNGKVDNFSKINTDVRFPKYMQKAGYSTAVIGKWHLGDNENPSDYGFDHWMVYINQGTY
ncbi:MAG: sulfatase-like hydrolase/transferase, partial [Lentisphaeria bacterium]